GTIRRNDLRRATPYNTYTIDGLPPTPIAMPGRDSLLAAVNPKPGRSLYFVARGDGSHVFSETLQQHDRAVRHYQILTRATNYRSSPPPAESSASGETPCAGCSSPSKAPRGRASPPISAFSPRRWPRAAVRH